MADMYLELNQHLARVIEALHGTESKWRYIGIQLKIEHSILVKIHTEHKNSVLDCNREMLTAWLKSGRATWKKLVKALRKKTVGHDEEADSIEKKYIVKVNDQNRPGKDDEPNGTEELKEHSQNVCSQERLREILEWILKMGFTLEDMQNWIDDKKAATVTPLSRRPSTIGNSSKRKSEENTVIVRKRSNPRSSQMMQPSPKRSRPEELGRTETREVFSRRSSLHRENKRSRTSQKRQKMVEILMNLQKEKVAEDFIDLVEEERAPDYYGVIKNPMCLQDMKRKAKCGEYNKMKEFCDDFRLIIKNCHDYNPPDHDIIKQADQLETKFCELTKDLSSDESDSDSPLKSGLPSDAETSDEESENGEQPDNSDRASESSSEESESEVLHQSLDTEIQDSESESDAEYIPSSLSQ